MAQPATETAAWSATTPNVHVQAAMDWKQWRHWVKDGPPWNPLPTSPPGTLAGLACTSHLRVRLDELPARLTSAVDSAPRLLGAGDWLRHLSQAPHHRTH